MSEKNFPDRETEFRFVGCSFDDELVGSFTTTLEPGCRNRIEFPRDQSTHRARRRTNGASNSRRLAQSTITSGASVFLKWHSFVIQHAHSVLRDTRFVACVYAWPIPRAAPAQRLKRNRRATRRNNRERERARVLADGWEGGRERE